MSRVYKVPARRGDEPEHPSEPDSLFEETLALARAPLVLEDEPVDEREKPTVFQVHARVRNIKRS